MSPATASRPGSRGRRFGVRVLIVAVAALAAVGGGALPGPVQVQVVDRAFAEPPAKPADDATNVPPRRLDGLPGHRPSAQRDAATLWQAATPPQLPQRQTPQDQTSQDQTSRPPKPTAQPREFTVGVKRPGAERGVWQGRILIDRAEVDAAARQLDTLSGVDLLGRDKDLPIIHLSAANQSALQRIRDLPGIDYIEPALARVTGQQVGCDQPALHNLGSHQHLEPGDVLPYTFGLQAIPQAWGRSAAGRGATVAVLDTGVVQASSQITPVAFSNGYSSGRWVSNRGSNSWWFHDTDTPWTDCGHGTRVAGTIAAPRDGVSTVGVAWRSNLVTVQVAQWVAVNHSNEWWIIRGIDIARDSGAKILNMSLASTDFLMALGDKIRYESTRTDKPDLLFVNAIGSTVCVFPLFPGNALDVTLSVAGMKKDGIHVASSSCKDADVGGIVGDDDLETVGRTPTEVTVLGASSGGTAEVSGIAALVWATHPDWTAQQVRARLETTAQPGLDGETTKGSINAFAAVGGLQRVDLDGPRILTTGHSATLVARPHGDGPFDYAWTQSTGGRPPSPPLPEHGSTLHIQAGQIGSTVNYQVKVTDRTDLTQVTGTRTVSVQAEDPEPPDPPDPEKGPCRVKPWLPMCNQ